MKFIAGTLAIGFTVFAAQAANAYDLTKDDVAQYGHNPNEYLDWLQRGVDDAQYDILRGLDGWQDGYNQTQTRAYKTGYTCIQNTTVDVLIDNGAMINKNLMSPRRWHSKLKEALGVAVRYCNGTLVYRLDQKTRDVNPYFKSPIKSHP